MEPAIVYQSGGVCIAGTRITVYDIYHYLESGNWTVPQIAEILRLTEEQILAAVKYIEEHKAEVLAVHRQIEERNARGNPPEIEAKAAASRAKRLAWLQERQQARSQEGNGDGADSGRQPSRTG